MADYLDLVLVKAATETSQERRDAVARMFDDILETEKPIAFASKVFRHPLVNTLLILEAIR